MNKTLRLLLAGVMALAGWTQAPAATIDLFEYAFNIDETVTNGSAPPGVNVAGFDTGTGLGTISVSITGPGAHYVSLFVDHEIDENINTFFNELGSTAGTAAAGQSWEIDEPGFMAGDIYRNFTNIALDSTNSISHAPNDVAMAIGWEFLLGADETALIRFVLSTDPLTGFVLTQIDPDSQASLNFASTLTIQGGEQGVPEPGALLLVGAALLALLDARRRRA